MNKSNVFSVAMAAMTVGAVWISCSSGGSGSSTTSTSTGGQGSTSATTSGSSSSVATTGASTGAGGGGGASGEGGGGGAGPDGGAGIFSCNSAPATAPSGGSCVTVAANDAGTGIECNPVTNAPCATGEQCDINTDNTNDIIGWIRSR